MLSNEDRTDTQILFYDSTSDISEDDSSDSHEMTEELPCKNVSHVCNKKIHNTWRHLQLRELGTNSKRQHCEGFSKSDQSHVFSRYLPNSVKNSIEQPAKVFCGCYSQDGSMFMSASQDHQIRLYDTTTDQLRLLQEVLAQNVGWTVVDTAYSSDNKHLIYSSWSPAYIYLCDMSGGHSRQDHIALDMRPCVRSFCAFSITFSQDNREILAGSNDKSLYIYDRGCSRRTLRIEGHTDDVNTVCFCDDSSQLLFSGSDDGLCKVWDRRALDEQNPKPVGTFAGHSGGITFIDSKRDGHHLITNSKDQTIKLWDVRKFSNAESVRAGKWASATNQYDYRWDPFPKRFVGRVKGDPSVMTYRGHTVLRCLIRAYFSPSHTTAQRYIYTGSADGQILIYDVLTGRVVLSLMRHTSVVRDVSWHPYKPFIISTSWDHTLKQWHYKRKKEEQERSAKEIERDEIRKKSRKAEKFYPVRVLLRS